MQSEQERYSRLNLKSCKLFTSFTASRLTCNVCISMELLLLFELTPPLASQALDTVLCISLCQALQCTLQSVLLTLQVGPATQSVCTGSSAT